MFTSSTAEDAQILIRNVNYEVPSLKKLSAKYEQQISDLERMIETSRKQSKSYLNEYASNTKKLDIEVLARQFLILLILLFYYFLINYLIINILGYQY